MAARVVHQAGSGCQKCRTSEMQQMINHLTFKKKEWLIRFECISYFDFADSVSLAFDSGITIKEVFF